MAGAGNFDRLLSQSLEITDAAQTGLDITGPITVEAWVNLGETGNDPYAILYKWRGASCSNGPPYYLRATGGDVGYARENFAVTDDCLNAENGIGGSTTSMQAGNWYHLVGVYDGSNIRMYKNGGETNSAAHSTGIFDSDGNLQIGVRATGQRFDGLIDEVRISNTNRDACWIETEYSNQNTPASFYIVGSQQTTAADVYSFRKPLTIDSAQVGTSCTSTTDTWQISANDRDAWDDTSSGSLNSSIFGDLQWSDAGGYQWAVNIPQGATITSAKVRVYPTSHGGSTTSSYTARIRVEDTDNASAFTGAPNDIYTRTYWGTTIDWTIPAAGLPINTWSESPDITTLIQHIVNKGTWSPGNYLSIAIWGETVNGTGCNEGVTDYNTNASLAAQLEVTYQTGSGSIQDFPVMVKLTGTDFQEVEDNVDADGYDIIFKAEDDTTCGGVGLAPCTLDHEIEVYDETNDLLVAWVRVPEVSATADTNIYMYYGNPAISST
jgi:hypothetical protein